MSDEEPAQIKNVSDTALWVATYRAEESRRPDALFRDLLAERLAGERGVRIAAEVPYPRIMHWFLVVRTVAIDRLIMDAIARGVDTVINLGAGLDARPYRMALPSELRWIEVDFPGIVEFKDRELKAEKPRCRLERIAVDLSNGPARRELFDRMGSEARQAVVLTEGVIPYLTPADAAALSKDLAATPSFAYWIQDYRQGGFSGTAAERMKKFLRDSPFRFDQPDWLGFFTKQGWVIDQNILAVEESERVGRPFPLTFPWNVVLRLTPSKVREKWRRAAGYVMYRKGGIRGQTTRSPNSS